MNKSSVLTGTSWHVERFHREEGEPRRSKSRCIYYEKEGKHCRYLCERCTGSAHCTKYKEKRKE